MVMAEDGARLDRRYTYKAVEDVGGFCFENGKAVGPHTPTWFAVFQGNLCMWCVAAVAVLN